MFRKRKTAFALPISTARSRTARASPIFPWAISALARVVNRAASASPLVVGAAGLLSAVGPAGSASFEPSGLHGAMGVVRASIARCAISRLCVSAAVRWRPCCSSAVAASDVFFELSRLVNRLARQRQPRFGHGAPCRSPPSPAVVGAPAATLLSRLPTSSSWPASSPAFVCSMTPGRVRIRGAPWPPPPPRLCFGAPAATLLSRLPTSF